MSYMCHTQLSGCGEEGRGEGGVGNVKGRWCECGGRGKGWGCYGVIKMGDGFILGRSGQVSDMGAVSGVSVVCVG